MDIKTLNYVNYGNKEEKTFLPEEKYYFICPYQLFNLLVSLRDNKADYRHQLFNSSTMKPFWHGNKRISKL